MSAATSVLGQEVIVFDNFPPIPGAADDTEGLRSGVGQRILVIPVISQGTPFDPANNLLDGFDPAQPTLHADLVTKFTTVNDFWNESSFGAVTFDAVVLDRYFQMPRGPDHYFNPAYVSPRLQGAGIRGATVTVPGGQVRLLLHISDADETTLNLTFDAADSPYTPAALEAAIDDDLAITGGKLDLVVVTDCGANCRRLRFEVPTTYARACTFVHIDFAASDAAVIEALGLTRTTLDLAVPRVTGSGIELSYTSLAGDVLHLVVGNDVDPDATFDWVMGAATFNAPADFIAVHGATHPAVTITTAGGQLRFDVAPAIVGPYKAVRFEGPSELLDRLGLDTSTEQDGVINPAASNTIKGDRRLIAGQAIAAFTLNEMLRDGTPVDAAHEAEIRAFLTAQADPARIVAVVFLDAPDKRAGASGGYIPVGLRNGGFDLVHLTKASIQIQYDRQTFRRGLEDRGDGGEESCGVGPRGPPSAAIPPTGAAFSSRMTDRSSGRDRNPGRVRSSGTCHTKAVRSHVRRSRI